MARWAVGDIQGCGEELTELIKRVGFKSDRDQIWFVGDLVNRGPESLQVLRLVRSLGDSAVTVLGNHDLHLLAVALVQAKIRKSDTLSAVLAAPDREALLEWLLQRPLVHFAPEAGDLLLHAGVVPQWSVDQTLELAAEVQQGLRSDPRKFLAAMYGDQPDRWQSSLKGADRLRFTVNVLTRLRFCTPDGRVDLKQSGRPGSAPAPLMPWFKAAHRASTTARIVFGHWSALGFYSGDRVLALDTGCVWGGALTAIDLDAPQASPVSVPSRQPRSIE
ncbi:MAG TPA: symmetrical bis(5'-nucleosyl)-tetraphosphatase [Steroidobacteraceae bacterium]|jgi:bis(5'-nucleosyl)-tetraphosphatase (symmetrical)|nr:symmetrical bis(5'-nucleosyl)-tetraphosphatase [Steroidobacteraceae bacterium]